MKSTLTVSEAQAQLPKLLRGKQTITICRRNDPVFYLVPKERWDAIAETLDLLGNTKATRILRAAKARKLKYTELDLEDENFGL